jgi:hypothetical protein
MTPDFQLYKIYFSLKYGIGRHCRLAFYGDLAKGAVVRINIPNE